MRVVKTGVMRAFRQKLFSLQRLADMHTYKIRVRRHHVAAGKPADDEYLIRSTLPREEAVREAVASRVESKLGVHTEKKGPSQFEIPSGDSKPDSSVKAAMVYVDKIVPNSELLAASQIASSVAESTNYAEDFS